MYAGKLPFVAVHVYSEACMCVCIICCYRMTTSNLQMSVHVGRGGGEKKKGHSLLTIAALHQLYLLIITTHT